MLNGNQLDRYGAIAKSIGLSGMINPNAKVFFVGATTLASYQDFMDDFPIDKTGGNRIFATMAAAVADGNLVAARGDMVFVMAGHAESISSATALNLSKSGVSFIGLGEGGLRPIITLDTGNDSTITVSAANIVIKNMVFVANFLNVAALFTLTTAKDFQLLNCEVRDTDTTHNFVAMVVLATTANAADGLKIDGNKFFLLIATGATKLVSFLGATTRVTITNNYYSSPTTNAGAVMPVATGKAILQLLVDSNKFNLVNAAGTATGLLITADTAGTGYVSNNLIQVATTTPLGVTAARGWVETNNLYTHTANKSGYVMPVIDASS